MAEVDAGAVTTPSVSTAVTYAVKPAAEVDVAAQVFNPLQAVWISDPVLLPGTPVTGSVVRWTQSAPAAGSTVLVETSINNGASWDKATPNAPVGRLAPGDVTTRQILIRVTFTRLSGSDATPRVTNLEVRAPADSSTDELVPIAHGMVNKVTASVTGGTGSGSGSGSSGGGGTGGISSVGGGQVGGGISLKLHGVDPSRAISRNVWQQPFFIPSGMTYGAAVKAMVADRLPEQTDFSLASTTQLTPLLIYGVNQGGDPWKDIQELAQAIGYEVFFDAAGVLVFRPTIDPRGGIPVWEFDENFNPTVIDVKRELSDEDTFNYVVVKGESTSTKNPVTAFAFDNDPNSPTYVNGNYGTVATVLTFQNIQTQDQAQQAANATLLNSLGAAETVTIKTVPMPALEPGDVVTVNVQDVLASGTYVINAMTTPLSPAEAQELTCFRQSTQK